MFDSEGENKLNKAFHLSSNENVCTIVRNKNIHYLFHITSEIKFCYLQRFISLKILENANSVLIAPVLLNDDVTCVQWSIHVTLYHPFKREEST